MEKQPRHRPPRKFENAKCVILDCELTACPHCGEPLTARRTWHMRKTIQTLEGPLFVAGKTKECAHAACRQMGAALLYDDELRKWMRQDLGGLPKASEASPF